MAELREWGGVTYGLTGDAEVKANLAFYASAYPGVAIEELEVEAGIEIAEAARRAPIDTDPRRGERGGELRESARLERVQTDDGFGVALIFGGVEVPYAVAQHQKFYTHEEGSREYLIDTLDTSKRFLGARLARRIEARVSSMRRSA